MPIQSDRTFNSGASKWWNTLRTKPHCYMAVTHWLVGCDRGRIRFRPLPSTLVGWANSLCPTGDDGSTLKGSSQRLVTDRWENESGDRAWIRAQPCRRLFMEVVCTHCCVIIWLYTLMCTRQAKTWKIKIKKTRKLPLWPYVPALDLLKRIWRRS